MEFVYKLLLLDSILITIKDQLNNVLPFVLPVMNIMISVLVVLPELS
jgi:hypothetical protein